MATVDQYYVKNDKKLSKYNIRTSKIRLESKCVCVYESSIK